jgi:hypothetical protein
MLICFIVFTFIHLVNKLSSDNYIDHLLDMLFVEIMEHSYCDIMVPIDMLVMYNILRQDQYLEQFAV